ncbi:hypothetical protein CAPTEDRAFT_221712 [Capitella teleta]|uniref:Neurotransmitter-gated ion-channel ligand-binding domain-containing protein n=1 Tax=Capitella teleta TaxID=283909 RepID=R7TPS0_CAPTE|nr:hypothetical protein CAPTEDRAFT_221712 [Capitella teleta]|eukprot:ELT93511.1 hypothetical protein CAPTEDRAFT_221712 [Capitella teleta]
MQNWCLFILCGKQRVIAAENDDDGNLINMTQISNSDVAQLTTAIRSLEHTIKQHFPHTPKSAGPQGVPAPGQLRTRTSSANKELDLQGSHGLPEGQVGSKRKISRAEKCVNLVRLSNRSFSDCNRPIYYASNDTIHGKQMEPCAEIDSYVMSVAKRLLNIRSTKRGRVTVYVRVVFLKVGEIDTLKEKYSADVFIQAKWREPLLDGKAEIEIEEVDWDEYWNPCLFVENEYGEAKQSVWYSVSLDELGQATVCEKRRLNGSFLEYLELNQFPFDTQDLTITVTSDKGEAEVDLVEDRGEGCDINVQSFVDEQEWHLHSHVHTWRKITTKIVQNTKYKHPALSAACKASRRPGFFVWNILVVMMFICSLSFGTFTVDIDLPQNRLQLSFILLLTTITFKFVVNQSLPRISYLTYMDKYILTSMSILCCICVWHAIVPLIMERSSKDIANRADHVALGLFALCYIVFHVFFVFWVAYVVNTARKRVTSASDKDEKSEDGIVDMNTNGTIENPSSKKEKPKISCNVIDFDENNMDSAHSEKKSVNLCKVGPLLEEASFEDILCLDNIMARYRTWVIILEFNLHIAVYQSCMLMHSVSQMKLTDPSQLEFPAKAAFKTFLKLQSFPRSPFSHCPEVILATHLRINTYIFLVLDFYLMIVESVLAVLQNQERKHPISRIQTCVIFFAIP